jgi:hypothetical protein
LTSTGTSTSEIDRSSATTGVRRRHADCLRCPRRLELVEGPCHYLVSGIGILALISSRPSTIPGPGRLRCRRLLRNRPDDSCVGGVQEGFEIIFDEGDLVRTARMSGYEAASPWGKGQPIPTSTRSAQSPTTGKSPPRESALDDQCAHGAAIQNPSA